LTHLLPRIAELRQELDEPLAPLLAAHARTALLETVRLIENGASQPSGGFGRETVRQFLTRLEARCKETWTLEEMARVSGFGRTRVAMLVKEVTGDNPVRYLNRLRFNRACGLLKQTDRSVTEIGVECGFCDGAYFARVFKSFAGMSPSDYRRRFQ